MATIVKGRRFLWAGTEAERLRAAEYAAKWGFTYLPKGSGWCELVALSGKKFLLEVTPDGGH